VNRDRWGPTAGTIALALTLSVTSGCGPGGRATRSAADSAGRDRARSVTSGPAKVTIPDTTPVVLFLGNSLTAGLGLLPEQAYPSLMQAKIDSAGLGFRVVNAGVSGATSADGVRMVGTYLNLPVAVVVLELGANDMLRGQDLDATRRNLEAIVDSIQARRPAAEIVIAGMRAPPNLGPAYTERFRDLYPELARHSGAALIPFLLEGVAADPALNQADGMHPNAAGERIVAEDVWKVLEGVLRRVREGSRAEGGAGS